MCHNFRLLLGYDGTSNVMKVVSKGDGGLQELQEDLVCNLNWFIYNAASY